MALLAVGLSAATTLRSEPLTAPIASYEISCRLLPERKTVEGTELLTWTNRTSKPAATLRLHLYLNAFRNTASTFWKETRGRRGRRRIPDSWGSIEITRMTLSDGTDLLAGLRFIAPDDGNPDDRTVVEVDLPRPVDPGGTAAVSIDFVSRLPRVAVRTGYKGDFYLVAQWFPKVGVLQEGGWSCHQFHSNSEFFSDFGDYDVSIEVPGMYRGHVGATGRVVLERPAAGDRLVYRFRQESVHDFAWTADPGYLVRKDAFREPGIADVEVTLLLQPEHARQEARYFRAARAALSGYGRILGAYPYGTLTIVDPPWGAAGAGGMEYPTFITAGTSVIAPSSLQSPEKVTVHEFGHQYFYGLLASNEPEEAWLDEGFNEYMTERVMRATYGSEHAELEVFGVRLPLGIDKHRPLDTNRRAFQYTSTDAIAVPSWKILSREAYGALAYSKTALTLATLERLIGTPAMDRALRLYADRWRFRHPTTADFIAAVDETTGRDWTWFFRRTLESSAAFDYSVATARTERSRSPRGLSEKDGRLVESRAAPLPGWDSEVLVLRKGDFGLPVEILLRFAGGRTYRSSWDGEARWKRFRVARGPRLLEAVVDPDEKILLDRDRTNNGMRTDSDPRAASRWTARAVFWLQNLLDFGTVAW